MSSTYRPKSRGFSRNRHAHVVKTPPFNPSHPIQGGEVEETSKHEFVSKLTTTSTDPSAEEVHETLREKGELIDGSELHEDVNDVPSQLEKLRLVVEEDGLPEEQIRINNQLQEDELLALEAIYGDNLTILGRQEGKKSFQVHIHIEFPDKLTVSAKLLYSSNESEGTSTTPKPAADPSDEGFLYIFKVQHLPPIVLTCLLPNSYPSHQPPCFNISIQWLDSLRISSFCSILDSLWISQPGQEVIYQWVEWLHNSSLSYIGIDKEIFLGPYNMADAGDSRAVSGSVSPEVDISAIMNYNDDRCNEVFLDSLHECCICFSEYPGTEFVRLPCKHFFCWKCMETYSAIHVKEGTVNKLVCPDAKCGDHLPLGLLKRLLGKEEFERWESLLLQKTLDSMSDLVYCPRCETGCLEDLDHHAQCPKCFFNFCSICGEQRHVGVTCMRPETRLQMLEERQESGQLGGEEKRREREKINVILSLNKILSDYKRCPSCKMAISRAGGCNKMVCRNCGKAFCYKCNMIISGDDHFGRDRCDVFPSVETAIREWKERIGDRLPENPRHQCPICRHMNSKVGNNNHIFCSSCRNHYCFLCRKKVRRSTEHYGHNGDCDV